MAIKEQSFVLKRGEGLHDKNLIKHTVLHVEPSRTSTVESAGAVNRKNGKPLVKTSYVSPMARARQLAKQRQETGAMSDSTGASRDWDESLASSSSPSNSESAVSSVAGTPSVSKPSSVQTPRLMSSSGHIPKSGYIPKSGSVKGEEASNSGRVPKFGVWDNNNNNDNGPCYTLLFENVAQEKRSGGQIRIHSPRPCSPSHNEDLYNYNPSRSIKAARKTRHYHSLLCCFVGS